MCSKLEDFAHNGRAWPDHLTTPNPILYVHCTDIARVPLMLVAQPTAHVRSLVVSSISLGPTIARNRPNARRFARSGFMLYSC